MSCLGKYMSSIFVVASNENLMSWEKDYATFFVEEK